MNSTTKPQKERKVYDCFTYFNEDKLLDLRLQTHWDFVDYFIICESSLTFSGKPKSINFDINRFKKYESKIRYLLLDQYDFKTNEWWVYEPLQRDHMINGLYDACDDDLIIISDLDEIIRSESIFQFDSSKYYRAQLSMKCYAYYINNLWINPDKTPAVWKSAAITTFGLLKSKFNSKIERVRNYKAEGIFRSFHRKMMRNFKTQLIENAGWHFTFMGGVEKIIEKIEGSSHQEYDYPEYKNPTVILERIKNGQDVLGRPLIYELQETNIDFPHTLKNNLGQFEDWILKK
jgi:beta-1,4-mannosyl-glycoprotein beta-1,4-N-acetylglucosaminyltransferase